MRRHDRPPATEPHVYWFGNSSTLVDRVLALIERWQNNYVHDCGYAGIFTTCPQRGLIDAPNANRMVIWHERAS